jgi:hypothetical protein
MFQSNPSELPYRVPAKTLVTAFEGTLQERYPGSATMALAEEREVNINGKRFYQVIVNWRSSPTEGIQVTGKWLLYLLQTDKVAYNLGLIERTRNEFRGKVVRDNGFWVQGTLRPW